jgi:hypothetical protein
MEAFDDHEFDALYDTARTVRPYTVTGGRTRTDRAHLPLEALVRAVRAPGGPAGAYGPAPEMRRIVELTTDRILSVAELSAHLHLPLGVVRVLVGDLADAGAVVVHGAAATSAKAPATDLQVLKGVLDGIVTL